MQRQTALRRVFTDSAVIHADYNYSTDHGDRLYLHEETRLRERRNFDKRRTRKIAAEERAPRFAKLRARRHLGQIDGQLDDAAIVAPAASSSRRMLSNACDAWGAHVVLARDGAVSETRGLTRYVNRPIDHEGVENVPGAAPARRRQRCVFCSSCDVRKPSAILRRCDLKGEDARVVYDPCPSQVAPADDARARPRLSCGLKSSSRSFTKRQQYQTLPMLTLENISFSWARSFGFNVANEPA